MRNVREIFSVNFDFQLSVLFGVTGNHGGFFGPKIINWQFWLIRGLVSTEEFIEGSFSVSSITVSKVPISQLTVEGV